MWWDKDGLTSGGAECAPVRVFLAPSFCVFMCRLLSRQGLWNSGVLRVIWRSAAGVLLLAIVSCLGVIPRKERMSPMHMVAGKLGLWRKRGISSPGVDCEGARAACPARRWGGGGALLGYSWQSFVLPILCCDLLCLRCYKKFRMPSMRRLRA